MTDVDIEVRILGPVEVVLDGRAIELPGRRGRTFVCRLAAAHPSAVRSEVLVDAVWGARLPENPSNALQGVASKIRRSAGLPDVICMTGGGYVFAPATSIDVAMVDPLVDRAASATSQGNHALASELLRDALALWRGEPLVDVADHDWALPLIAELEQRRSQLLEERIAADLELGRAEELIAELEHLVRAEPFRERFWAHLMRALYNSGRQADALAAFQSVRRVLDEELGLSPGDELVELEAAILRQDSELRRVSAVDTTAKVRRTNLRRPLGDLVGRTDDLDQLAAAVTERRLVVLVGPGGVGKTRLALEVGRRLVDDGHEVWVVDLSAVGREDAVTDAVSDVLGVQERNTGGSVRSIARSLSGRSVFLVLDNAEHLVEPVSELVVELLSSCPELHVVLTSREAFGVNGAVTWVVPPLSVEHSVELFRSTVRAEASGAAATVADEDVQVVTEICTRLDGLPLAVLLAAARAKVLTPAEILDRLDDRFRLLSGSRLGSVGRQQTLRAVVDWSHELLSEAERRTFEALAVFAGPFDVAGAERVCTALGIDGRDVVDHLARLVDASLVTRLPASSGTARARFRMLQTLSEYGRERLMERGELDRARGAHVRHVERLVPTSTPAFLGRRQTQWLHQVRMDAADVSAALDWLATRDDGSERALAGALGWYWWVTGRPRAGLDLLRIAIDHGPGHDPSTAAWCASWATFLGLLAGEGAAEVAAMAATARGLLDDLEPDDPHRACGYSLVSEALVVIGERASGFALAAQAGELASTSPHLQAQAPYLRARSALGQGDIERARTDLIEGVERLDAAGDRILQSLALSLLADLCERSGDTESALAHARRALAVVQPLGLEGADISMTARCAHMLLAAGRPGEARSMFDRAAEIGRRLDFPAAQGSALVGLAVIERIDGRPEVALHLAADGLSLAEKVGLDNWIIGALVQMALSSVALGDPGPAAASAARARQLADQLGDPRHLASALVAEATALIESDRRPEAQRVVERATELRGRSGLVPSWADAQDLHAVLERLGDA